MTDVRQAFRKLAKSPGFTLTAIATLAISLGANSAIFGIINGVLLRPPPFPEPDRLVAVRCVQPAMSWAVVADYHEYLDWKEQTEIFQELAVYNGFTRQTLVTDGGAARSLYLHIGSANYLRTLGLRPLLGRDLTDADCVPGAAPVALISHALWQSQFSGRTEVVGESVKLGGRSVTIAGVLPRDFVAITPNELPVDALLPLDYTRTTANRGNHHLWVFGRLRDGVSLQQATLRLNEVAERLKQEHNTVHNIALFSLQEWSAQFVRPRLLALMGAVALVLFIACVNVANLQLVRVTGRTAEISIKMAVGAGRWRVTRELMWESILLAVAGGLIGTLLAAATLQWAETFIRSQFNTFAPVRLGGAGLAFSLTLTAIAVLLSGAVPAWRATSSWETFMRAIGRSAIATPQQRRLNHIFIVAQVGLTLLVLVGAGLLVRSMHRLMTQEKGFATANLLTFRVDLPSAVYDNRPKRRQFYNALLERLRALPGVEAVATGDSIPLRTGSNGYFRVPGITWPADKAPLADKLRVSPGYFHTLGIALLRGREFDAALDSAPTTDERVSRSVIINEAFAKKYFGDRDPIGERVALDGGPDDDSKIVWDRVVGVVADARMVSLDREPTPALYACTEQTVSPAQYFVVRSPLDAAALLGPIRSQLQALDPAIPLTRLSTLQSYVESALSQRRLITITIGIAGAVALGLAVLGLYSVIAYTVAQQTREIGVRLALGAEPARISRWVLSRGLKLVAIGIVLGAGSSVLMVKLLGSLVYGVSAWDLPTYSTVIALLSIVGVLACWVPARRASRVDPMTALRAE